MLARLISMSLLVLLAVFLFFARSAEGTYSIIACDAKTKECGVAVQTNNLAVGASVPYAQAGVGALVSQFETNPHYGARGLELLAHGLSPEDALKQLLAEDGNFEGQGPKARQVALVSIDGRTGEHTGEEALAVKWAGARFGPGYSIQGNGLAGPQVAKAMEQAFLTTQGALAERLMAALSGGDWAGGQSTGRESAALLVRTPDGWPLDIDLRVDHSADPVGDLRKLLDLQMARQQVLDARRAAKQGRPTDAKALLIRAVARGAAWPRVWLQAAEVAADTEESELALQYLAVAFAQNPAWIKVEIGDGKFSDLGREPLFRQWVSSAQRQQVMADYQAAQRSTLTPEKSIETARKLLEVGLPAEATATLTPLVKDQPENAAAHSLLAEAYASQNDFVQADKECQIALHLRPEDYRLRAQSQRLRKEHSR